jgi:hypothetical protein
VTKYSRTLVGDCTKQVEGQERRAQLGGYLGETWVRWAWSEGKGRGREAIGTERVEGVSGAWKGRGSET